MQPLAQPPRKDDRSFDDWMFRLWKRISSAAGLSWLLVDKTGSNLTDIETRNHADLQNINTASYTHLTATNHTDLTDGGVTTLHKHDHGYVTYPESLKIGSPTHLATLQDSINHMWSAGLVDGGALTDNGDGTVTIAVGTAVTHASTNPHTDLYQAIVPQRTLTLTDGVANYIYVDYNSGTPQYAVGTSTSDFNCIDKCIIYLAHRSGTSVHTIDAREQNVDGNRKTRRLFLDFAKFIHAENGTVLGANGLAVTLTAGKFYFMLKEIDHVAFDTSVAGTANANVFTLWNHVAGVYTSTANSKVISTTLYDNGTGTTTLGNNKYGVTWFYVMNDSPSELHAVMGQVEYANAEEAEAASPPATLPGILTSLGSLVGYVIYEKSAVAFYDVRSAFSQRFTSSAATLHNGLGGIQGGSVNQYYHLTSAEYTGTGTGDFVRESSPTLVTPRMDNIGMGVAATSSVGIRLSSGVILSGSTTQYGNNNNVTFGSDCTSAGYVFYASPATTASTYTMTNLRLYQANGFTLGAGSAVTNYLAFFAENETNASNHYAFYGAQNVTNASDRNCYMAGLAPNYFAGKVMVGTNTDDGVSALQVTGTTAITASSGAALTVTNTGTGNSFVVNDANPDASPFIIDATGTVITGDVASITINTVIPKVQVLGVNSTSNSTILAGICGASAAGASYNLFKTRGTAFGDLSAVVAGDLIGQLSWVVDDGADYNNVAAWVRCYAASTATAGAFPSYLSLGTAGATGAAVDALRIDSTQAVLAKSPTGGLGYGSGAGGTVTQLTSKATGVTLSKVTGAITMNAAALAAATTVSFTLTNTTIAATDTVIVQHTSGGTGGAYSFAAFPAAGSATIFVRNVTAGSLSEAIVLRVTVIKSVSA